MLNGDNFGNSNSSYTCDLVALLQDSHYLFGTYKGYQNFYLNPVAAVLIYASVGIGLDAGSATLSSNNPDTWLSIQAKYDLNLRSALRRIMG